MRRVMRSLSVTTKSAFDFSLCGIIRACFGSLSGQERVGRLLNVASGACSPARSFKIYWLIGCGFTGEIVTSSRMTALFRCSSVQDLVGHGLQRKGVSTFFVRHDVGHLICIRVGTPVVTALRPGASCGVRAANVRHVRDCGQDEVVRGALVNNRRLACRFFRLVVIFAVVSTGSPFGTTNLLIAVIDRRSATWDPIKRVSRLIINDYRSYVRCLGFLSHAKGALYFSPITCLVKFRRWGGRSTNGVLRVAKGHRASDRANEDRRDDGQDHLSTRYTCRKGGW